MNVTRGALKYFRKALDFMSYEKYNHGCNGGIGNSMTKMGRPKSDNAKKKVLSIRLSDETYEKLLKYAEENQMTLTEVALEGLEKTLSGQN